MNHRIAIIGLGYVGLPLAVEFAKKYKVIGFDINEKRINQLKSGRDDTLEVSDEDLNSVIRDRFDIGLTLTFNNEDIKNCNTYIITVPTPIDRNNRPILKPLLNASKTVGKVLTSNDIVIYESTVYPGVTEDECVPVLEKNSGLTYNKDFFCGYSPERINPGDKNRTLTKIKKVTSGSTKESALKIDNLYQSIITAGTHLASSIKVAEASKVIENTQRDLNIAFVNELAIIFNKLNIDTNDVLEAAGTKWNFLPFKPGLVGGHCIGVDPFYLAQKAQELGYYSEIILASRRLNDSMGEYIATEVLKMMILNGIQVESANILILGITFKENCPDIRNTKAVDVYYSLKKYINNINVYDPWANSEEVKDEYGIEILNEVKKPYDVIIHVVAHKLFKSFPFSDYKKKDGIIYDVKGNLPKKLVTQRL